MLKGFTEIHSSTSSGGPDLQNTDNINNIYQFKKKYISVAASGICFFFFFLVPACKLLVVSCGI